jgi:hypothetical protein
MPTLASPDIDEVICQALQTIFTNELQVALQQVEDPLAVITIHQADLQENPTLVAPYVVYRPDPEKGRSTVPHDLESIYGSAEIGGIMRYLHFYYLKYGSPIEPTRDQARADIAVVESRILRTLKNHFDLTGIAGISSAVDGRLWSADQSKVIDGANPYYMIDQIKNEITGGNNTFFGTGYVLFHYPVIWYS